MVKGKVIIKIALSSQEQLEAQLNFINDQSARKN